MNETIVQLSTPRFPSAIHIIRFSGLGSIDFLKKHASYKNNLKPRKVYNCGLYDGDELIDLILFFYMQSPKSYTGEDMVELHVHGSLAIVDRILSLAIEEGCRLARPGEFSYLAFINGKISLDQAEAIDSLIHSKNNFQSKNALSILEGKVSFKFHDLKEAIINMMAELESSIEFPEEDIPEIDIDKTSLYQKYQQNLIPIINYFKEIINNYEKGKKLADGFKLTIIGSPNSGKSTLFNSLLKEKRAITSSIRGTTRDYIGEVWKIDDLSIMLYDTAGIHQKAGHLEQEGIKKLPRLIEESDMVIWLVSSMSCLNDFISIDFWREIINDFKALPISSAKASKPLWVYLNKVDILNSLEIKQIKSEIEKQGWIFGGSFSLNQNSQEVAQKIEYDIKEWIKTNYFLAKKSLALLNQRQGYIAKKILVGLEVLSGKIKQMESEEIVVQEFHELNGYFSELDLKTHHEEVYDTLFSKFCIGK